MSLASSAFMYWVGMDTDPRTTAEALAEFNHFYSTVHVHEVVDAHPGFIRATRYELVEPDPRGGEHHGPRWLAVYDMADEAAALRYIKDNERPWLHRKKYSPWPAARRRAKTVWRMIWHSVSPAAPIADPQGDVVLVGVNDEQGAQLELYREFAHPAPGCPRFCLVSDTHSDEQGRDAVWRLGYRRIA